MMVKLVKQRFGVNAQTMKPDPETMYGRLGTTSARLTFPREWPFEKLFCCTFALPVFVRCAYGCECVVYPHVHMRVHLHRRERRIRRS